MASDRRLNVAILAGGRSTEHDVSRRSATAIIEALDRDLYEPLPVLIERTGDWRLTSAAKIALESQATDQITSPQPALKAETRPATVTSPSSALQGIDVIFPALHGAYGEDGAIQGLLETVDIPYVGAGVLSSAVGLDKAIFKAVLRDAGIPVTADVVVNQNTYDPATIAKQVEEKLAYPVFVKPARQGSSIGISRVASPDELVPAIAAAFEHDRKVLIETFVEGVEVECGIIGNDDPLVSMPGEVRVTSDDAWYDYETKYSDGHTELIIPADIPESAIEHVRELSLAVYQVIDCEGLARVDSFVTPSGEVFVNEINTMPGFTAHSAFPKLFEAMGIGYSELVDRLIQLAIDRHAAKGSMS